MYRLTIALVLLFTAALVAAELPAGKELTNSAGMKLVRIEAGTFVMGTGEAAPKTREEWDARDWDEAPAHKVKISKPFFIGATEVTNAQYEQFDPDHKKLRGKHGISKGDTDPVVMVTWQQAVEFCAWLSKKEGKSYRLPTEAEWEYACRAGTTTPYHTGDTLTAEQANFGVTADKKRITAIGVGSYKPNAWGLHDTHGNVAEWCFDWYGPYEAGEQTDPVGRADGWAKVTRGWSYTPGSHKLGAARYARSANRSGHLPDDANRVTGFRVVLGEMPTTKLLPVAEPPLNQKNVKQTPAPKDGPDPAKPYFADLAKGVSVPKDQWGPIYGAWNHFSAITVCPNGDVLAAWYTCVSESGPECAQAMENLRRDLTADERTVGNWILTIRPDLAFDYEDNARGGLYRTLFPVDHKTERYPFARAGAVPRLPEWDADGPHTLSFQQMIYARVLRAIYGPTRVAAPVIQRVARLEGSQMPLFERHPLNLTMGSMQYATIATEVRIFAARALAEYRQYFKTKKLPVGNSTACKNHGFPCDFIALCLESNPELRKKAIETKYLRIGTPPLQPGMAGEGAT